MQAERGGGEGEDPGPRLHPFVQSGTWLSVGLLASLRAGWQWPFEANLKGPRGLWILEPEARKAGYLDPAILCCTSAQEPVNLHQDKKTHKAVL